MVRAVVCRALGAPETLRLEEFPSRALEPGEVRVAIRAAGLNFPDVLMAAGEYQLKPELPFTPGMEAAGDVVEVGAEARGVAVGDKVIVKMRHGAFSDEAVVTPSQLTPMPSTFDYAEAATYLAAHGTAYHALIDRGRLEAGEVLLVHGAGGGVGLAAVEIGKMLGATVLGVRAGEAVRKKPALGEVRLKALLAWAEQGKLRPNISHRLPLQDFAKAMRLLIDRKAIGRVALVMD